MPELNWQCRNCKRWFYTILQLEYHDKYHCQAPSQVYT